MLAPKMAALEKFFKESKISMGFFVGDYVSICILVCFSCLSHLHNFFNCQNDGCGIAALTKYISKT